MVIATGWTYDYIRHNMTFKRYKYLRDAWRITPPLSHIVPIALGFEPDEEIEKAKSGLTEDEYQEQQYNNLIRDFAAAGGDIG